MAVNECRNAHVFGIPLGEAAGISVYTFGCGDVAPRILVDGAEERSFEEPVAFVILNDAKAIDPDIFAIQLPGDL
jgi:hypothetical protein